MHDDADMHFSNLKFDSFDLFGPSPTPLKLQVWLAIADVGVLASKTSDAALTITFEIASRL